MIWTLFNYYNTNIPSWPLWTRWRAGLSPLQVTNAVLTRQPKPKKYQTTPLNLLCRDGCQRGTSACAWTHLYWWQGPQVQGACHMMNDDCGDFSVLSLLWYQWQDKVSLWQPTYNNDWLPLLLWLHFFYDKTRIANHLTEFLIACSLRKVTHMFPLLWSSSTLSLPLRKS